MSRLAEILAVTALVALAIWAGTDDVINGKEWLLLLGIAAYLAFVVNKSMEDA